MTTRDRQPPQPTGICEKCGDFVDNHALTKLANGKILMTCRPKKQREAAK